MITLSINRKRIAIRQVTKVSSYKLYILSKDMKGLSIEYSYKKSNSIVVKDKKDK